MGVLYIYFPYLERHRLRGCQVSILICNIFLRVFDFIFFFRVSVQDETIIRVCFSQKRFLWRIHSKSKTIDGWLFMPRLIVEDRFWGFLDEDSLWFWNILARVHLNIGGLWRIILGIASVLGTILGHSSWGKINRDGLGSLSRKYWLQLALTLLSNR